MVGRCRQVDHPGRALAMRRTPEKWVLIAQTKDGQAAKDMIRRIRRGELEPYRDGVYEVRPDRSAEGEPEVWGRWMGKRS